MKSPTTDFETKPYTRSEVNERINRVLNQEPRIDPKQAYEYAVGRLELKYDLLSAGELGDQV